MIGLAGGVRGPLQQRPQLHGRRRRQHRLVVAGEDHSQRPGPLGKPGREDLGDHAAHRGSDDVCAVDAQMVQQRGGVVGHVLERVDRRAALADIRAGHSRQQRRTGVAAGHLGRQADVAVVVADDAQTLVDELLAETLAPQQQLRAESHDEQDCGVVRIAHVLVEDVELAGLGRPATNLHQASTSSLCSRLTSTMKLAK